MRDDIDELRLPRTDSGLPVVRIGAVRPDVPGVVRAEELPAAGGRPAGKRPAGHR